MLRQDRVFRWALALILIGMAACAPPQAGIPLVLRPDTRLIASVEMDSTRVREAIEIFRAAAPREAAICLHGIVRDTLYEGKRLSVVWVTGVTESRSDSSGPYNVFFSVSARERCGPHIGAGHSHTQVPPWAACTHSHSDAFVLFEDREAVFSMVFCQDGRLEILFQDGRRAPLYWLRQDVTR